MGLDNTFWLVTGGCGFIGISLIRCLLEQEPNTKIRVLDNLSVGSREDLSSVCNFTEVVHSDLRHQSSNLLDQSSKVELVEGDIKNYTICHDCCTGIDVIVHLAANTGVPQSVENPKSDMLANVAGTFNMLEAARQKRVNRFVFASSGAPLGEIIPPIHEELAAHPVSPYGASKLAGEGYCSAYFQSYGLQTVALRFGNVYGPRSKHKNSVVAKFIKQALNHETLEIYGDGNQTRDYIYIDDLIQAIIKSADKDGIGGEVFQIATNNETSVNELITLLKDVFSRNGIENIQIANASLRKGDVQRNFSDTTKAKKSLEWQSRVKLEDGLLETLRWYLANAQEK